MKLLNNLPDDCLRLIFYRVPLSDRIYLHRVCPRWGSLQSSTTSTIKSLKLHIATTEQKSRTFIEQSPLHIPYLDQIDQPSKSLVNSKSSLTFPALTPNINSQLTTLLANIESLQLNLKLSSASDLSFVWQLLSGLSDKLVSFEFSCWRIDPLEIEFDSSLGISTRVDSGKRYEMREDFTQKMLTMFNVLNHECTELRNLTINVKEYLCINLDGATELDFPCLERLNTFRFNSYDSFESLLTSLTKYASLKQIHIGNYIKDKDIFDLNKFIINNRELFQKFTSLPKDPSAVLGLVELTSLVTLNVDSKNLFRMTAHLAKLPNLVHICVDPQWDDLKQYENTASFTYHRLASVKVLKFLAHDYTNLQSKHWAWIFPSIETVVYRHTVVLGPREPDFATWVEQTKSRLQCFKLQCSTVERVFMEAMYITVDGISNTLLQHSKQIEIDNL